MAPHHTPFAENDVFLAPLSGYTDLPFRRACRRQGCLLAFTPLLDASALIHRNPRNRTILLRGEDEPWLGLQILGSKPDELGRAAEILNDREFDVLDFNMGCPVPKVTKRGAGAALSHNPELALQCVRALVGSSRFPVSAKIRIVSDEEPAPTIELGKRLQDAGIRRLTIHGRVWQRIYSGPVAVDVVDAVREALEIPVVANGAVFDLRTALELRALSGCRAIMVARGAIGNPWLFRQLISGDETVPGHGETCDAIEEQVRGMVELYGEKTGMRNARKIILAYLTGRGYRRVLRGSVTGISTVRQFEQLMRTLRSEGPSQRYSPDQSVAARLQRETNEDTQSWLTCRELPPHLTEEQVSGGV